jgi:hypothetical protein
MLYLCLSCETIVHCDLFPCQTCSFGPAKSRLCQKIWDKLNDGEFVTCEACHENLEQKTQIKKILIVDDEFRISGISGRGRKIIGYPGDNLIGRIMKTIKIEAAPKIFADFDRELFYLLKQEPHNWQRFREVHNQHSQKARNALGRNKHRPRPFKH